MWRPISQLVIMAATLAWLGAPAMAAKRVALVIGNSGYENTGELRNPRNDASDMAATLRRLEFEVIEGIDLKRRGMELKIRDFSKALQGADVGLFYYAGHGLQINGKNYLAPIDAALKSETDLDFEAIQLNLVLRQMERNTKVNLVFLDACRDNPMASTLARSIRQSNRSVSVGRGLARIDEAVGMLIAFSTQPGNVALDGDGRNSPFTTALLNHIETSGSSINDTMIQVRNDVLAATKGRQVPWENSSLTGKFFFKPGAKVASLGASPQPRVEVKRVDTIAQSTVDHTFWTSIRNSKDPALYREYVRRFPDGLFVAIAKARLNATRAIAVEAKEEPKVEGKGASTGTKVAGLNPTKTATAVDAATKIAPAIDPAAARLQLARDMQTALKALKCYTSSIDGIWGKGSRYAVQRFNRATGQRLASDPSETSLAVIKAWKGKSCAVVARVRKPKTRTRSTTSTRKAKPRPQQRRTTTARKPAPPRREPDPAPRSSGGIFIGGGKGGLILGGGIRF